MKTCAAFLALGLLVVADSSALAQRGRRGGGRYGWLNSLEQGKAEARQTGRALMVVVRCEP